ncbi:MAG: FAD-binding oxidoreductase [Ignavibacteriaceae bacterium]|nr:FAD-binding oxidoreductase [Ignavibacteriaceae bacterium]
MIVKTSKDEIQNFLSDASNFKGFCEAVYFPEDRNDVSQILKEANDKKIQVTIAGNGTGLAGARVPEGGIVISTDRLNKIIEINKQKFYAIAEPGVLLSELLIILRKNDLLYPPDPTENNCYLGGTVATNASGEKTFKYGPTRNFIIEMEVVLADGEILTLKRGETLADKFDLYLKCESGKEINIHLPDYKMPSAKNSAGYFVKPGMDAIDLFIGSEGTLGVITKIKIRLQPNPEKIISCVVFFNSEEDALNFIQKGREVSYTSRAYNNIQAIDALSLEYFDENTLDFMRDDYKQIPAFAKAGVWFEQEVNKANEEYFLDEWLTLIREFSGDEESAWFAFTEADKEKLQIFRHAISQKIVEFIAKNNVRKLGTDVAVPDIKFKELYYFSKKEAMESKLDFLIYGHFGNSHMHLNILPKTEEEYLKGKKIYNTICEKAVELGGTISAEHGIGKLKTEYFKLMYGEEVIKKMAELKKVFDPNLILGSGTIFKADIIK